MKLQIRIFSTEEFNYYTQQTTPLF